MTLHLVYRDVSLHSTDPGLTTIMFHWPHDALRVTDVGLVASRPCASRRDAVDARQVDRRLDLASARPTWSAPVLTPSWSVVIARPSWPAPVRVMEDRRLPT